MQAQRRIYEHAPRTISIPAEFHNASIEVLFLRLNEAEAVANPASNNADIQMKKILLSEPAHLTALSLDTSGFTFDREEANVR